MTLHEVLRQRKCRTLINVCYSASKRWSRNYVQIRTTPHLAAGQSAKADRRLRNFGVIGISTAFHPFSVQLTLLRSLPLQCFGEGRAHGTEDGQQSREEAKCDEVSDDHDADFRRQPKWEADRLPERR